MQNTSRTDRARFVAANGDSWLRLYGPNGEKLGFGIPSATRPDMHHATNLTMCTCEDFRLNNNRCYHLEAVRLYVDKKRAEKAATGT